MMRLRCGKFAASDSVPRLNSLMIRPRSAIAVCRLAVRARGYTRSGPVPTTAIVRASAANAPL